MDAYFLKFENRKPPEPLEYSASRELLWQFFATVCIGIGAWYISWRWMHSLNPDALWFAIPMAMAETAAYIGLVLFIYNLWSDSDVVAPPPPEFASDCFPGSSERPVAVDVFFPTYDEDPELVELSLRDALKIHYPHPIDIRIHVLDDGKRDAMKKIADDLGVNYITRNNNVGFKAGNLRNAMEITSGDIIVICDADTRPFPTILEHTLGHFRDRNVAWVQTPQWFFDLPEGKPLPLALKKWLSWPGYGVGKLVEAIIGPVKIGQDPFVSDPQMFYDIIQRRRNAVDGSFCCGAGSIHRREAVMEAALKTYADSIDKHVLSFTEEVRDPELRANLDEAMRMQAAIDTEVTPYKFHVSEDIYTSIVLHSDPDRSWKSVMHTQVESKMLSPQDLQSWMVQRFKYAGGTVDIAVNDNPLFNPGMKWNKKIMYLSTMWSNFGALWNMVFILSPIIFLFTGIAPVAAYNTEFFIHILPFIVVTEISFMLGTWGVAGFKGKASYLAFFPVGLRAIWTVLRGKKISFPTTPKERQEGNFFHMVIPQFACIVLTLVGIVYATANYYISPNNALLYGLIANIFWGLNNIAALSGLVLSAFWAPEDDEYEVESDVAAVQAANPA
ncbi:MAG: glycosyltransferase [Pseudomonadota bacterium]